MGLLFDEHPLVLSPTLAKSLGNLNEAVFVQQLHYWLEIKKQSGKNFLDGRYWVYNSVEEWLKQFPWMSSATLRRTIESLSQKGLVIKGNYNEKKMDHTIWYSLDYEKIAEIDKKAKVEKEEQARIALESIPTEETYETPDSLVSQDIERIAQNEQIDLSKSANRIAQNEQIDLLKMSRSNCSKRADRIAQNEQTNTIDYPYINHKTTTTETTGARARPVEEEAKADVLSAYNELCPSFPKAIGMTPRRREMVQALLDEGISLSQIREAFCRAEQSDFLTGRAKGADWNRFDFDWFLQLSSIVSLLEGKYDNIAAQKQKRIAQDQAIREEHLGRIRKEVEPLTEERVSQMPPFLQDSFERHCGFSGSNSSQQEA